MAADVGRMGGLITDRLPDMLRLPDMDRQKTRPRPEALPDIRPRRDMDLPLHPRPARPDRKLCPHRGARAASPKEGIMRATTIVLSLVSLLFSSGFSLSLAQSAQPAPAQPVPWHPCAQITAACTQAGFVPNGAKTGVGIEVDCIRPIIFGTPQRQRASKPLPPLDPHVVSACKEESEFRNGWRATIICVQDTMMKIIILVVLTFALIALANRTPTKATDPGP